MTESERTIDAPVTSTRVTIVGELLSIKVREHTYGTSTKITVKVPGIGGVWYAWGGAPSELVGHADFVPGARVKLTAKLEAGRDRNFAVMHRPSGRMYAACQSPCLKCLGEPEFYRRRDIAMYREEEKFLRARGEFDQAVRVQSQADLLEWS